MAVFSGVGDQLVDSPILGGSAECETIVVAVYMLASGHKIQAREGGKRYILNHFKLEGLVAVVASGTLARYVKTGPLCDGSMACVVRSP